MTSNHEATLRLRATLLTLLLAGALTAGSFGGCSSSSADNDSGADAAAGRADAGVAGPDTAAPPPTPPPSALTCDPGKTCPPCADGKRGCADGAATIGDTCCAAGDPLQPLAKARGSEVVDLETDGTLIVACGGFGADVSRVVAGKPDAPVQIGKLGERCQRIAFGPKLGDTQVVYIAHHGDTWVQQPSLTTYSVRGSVTAKVHQIADAKVLFEGIAFTDGLLYAAAHAGGIRVYEVDARGVPTHLRTVTDGVKNAWKVAIVPGRALLVADAEAGLLVYSLADRERPKLLTTVATSGSARDLAVDGDRVYVALGGSGVDVFSAAANDWSTVTRVTTIATRGSAQAVEARGGVLAIAAWSHVALHDTQTLALLATERTRTSFEQDLGVAIDPSGFIYVGEWEGVHLLRYRPGFVAPDLFIEDDIFTLDPARPDRAVIVENLGVLPLEISRITVGDKSFSVSPAKLTVAPGKRESFTFTRPSPSPSLSTTLVLNTNDPDARSFERTISVRSTSRLGVGDAIDGDFSFLDPTGQLANLRGKVIVLAYFALF